MAQGLRQRTHLLRRVDFTLKTSSQLMYSQICTPQFRIPGIALNVNGGSAQTKDHYLTNIWWNASNVGRRLHMNWGYCLYQFMDLSLHLIIAMLRLWSGRWTLMFGYGRTILSLWKNIKNPTMKSIAMNHGLKWIKWIGRQNVKSWMDTRERHAFTTNYHNNLESMTTAYTLILVSAFVILRGIIRLHSFSLVLTFVALDPIYPDACNPHESMNHCCRLAESGNYSTVEILTKRYERMQMPKSVSSSSYSYIHCASTIITLTIHWLWSWAGVVPTGIVLFEWGACDLSFKSWESLALSIPRRRRGNSRSYSKSDNWLLGEQQQ